MEGDRFPKRMLTCDPRVKMNLGRISKKWIGQGSFEKGYFIALGLNFKTYFNDLKKSGYNYVNSAFVRIPVFVWTTFIFPLQLSVCWMCQMFSV
jgi:hypothetical protein